MFLYSVLVLCFLFNCCHCVPDTSSSPKCSQIEWIYHHADEGAFIGSQSNIDSYISYGFQKHQKTLNVSFDMKTRQIDGLVFYAPGLLPADFFALYYNMGSLQVGYHCDGYKSTQDVGALITNDNKWYTIQLTSNETRTEFTVSDIRSMKKFTSNEPKMEFIIIDENLTDKIIYFNKTRGCKQLELVSPYYFGSIGNKQHRMAQAQVEGHYSQFMGCLRNITINVPEPVDENRSAVLTCLQLKEGGISFGSEGSYILIDEHFGYHKLHNLRMSIKPNTNDAILLFYHSWNNSDSLILELVHGSLKLTVANESTTYNFDNALCDGEWHTFSVIRRDELYTIVVNWNTSNPIFLRNYNPANRGDGPLFLGGFPTNTYTAKGQQYIGCIDNFKIDCRPGDCVNNLENNGRKHEIFRYEIWGNITVNECPF